MKIRHAAILFAALLLGGCFGALQPAPQAEFDLGPVPPQASVAAAAPVRLRVSAPAWLADTALHYRLLYADPVERRQYAASRWTAPPAELLAHQLRRRLAGADFSRCALDVELVEFEQDFSRSDASRERLVARATLLPDAAAGAPAHAEFDLAVDAPTADARGGVAAAAQAAAQLGDRLDSWLKTVAPAARCESR